MLPLRVRHPQGVSSIQVDQTADVGGLLQALAAASGLPASSLEVKAGYPPRPVLWSSPAQPLASLKLAKNDQLIISASSSSSSDSTLVANGPPAPEVKPLSLPLKREAAAPAPAPPAAAPARSPPSQPPAAAARSAGGEDAAYVEVDGSFLVLYVVPDDNSCLFSAVAAVFEGGIAGAQKLRQVASAAIRDDPETYSEVFLERAPEEYARRMEDPKTWGGAIELSIFAAHYKTEIASVEIASGRIDHFGQGAGYASRCLLAYSGIHYDAILLSPTPRLDNPDFCQTTFALADAGVLGALERLAAELKRRHYYTDTATFDLRCGVCGEGLTGEKGATAHARTTGHADFREY